MQDSATHMKERLVAAMQLHVRGQKEAACEAYEALLLEWPGQAEILHPLGMLYLGKKEWKSAVRCFEQGLAARPGDPQHALPLAQAATQAGKPEQAVEAVMAVLSVKPDHKQALEIFYQLASGPASGLCCTRIEQMVEKKPNALTLRAAAAGLYLTLGRRAEELRHLDALNKRGIDAEAFYAQYAAALRNAGRMEHAMTVCNKALATSPKSVPLLKVRGDLFLERGQCDKALQDFTQCATLAPNDHYMRLRKGIAKLMMSDCKDGFAEFTAHYHIEIDMHKFAFNLPEWRGEPLAGKRLLVWASQGIGDIAMFASFLPWVLAQGAKVTLALYPRLMPLFARSFPETHVTLLTLDMPARHGKEHDYHIAIGQLMARALPHYTPAGHAPYLKADAATAAALRKKYLAASGGTRTKLVGISWHTTNVYMGMIRNIAPAAWQPLLSLPHIQFVSLQYGMHAEEIAFMQHQYPGALIADPGVDAFLDTDALSAQIAAMDEVVSIDNSTVHLAGALGIPVTMLLSAASEWRWGYKNTSCRWYKSLHIERQEQLLNWQPVMERVRKKLMA